MPIKIEYQLSVREHIIPVLREYYRYVRLDADFDWRVGVNSKSYTHVTLCNNAQDVYLVGGTLKEEEKLHMAQLIVRECRPFGTELTVLLTVKRG